MKTPRVSEFDPNAKMPSLKSPLEGMPTIGKPQQPTPVAPPGSERNFPAAETTPQPTTDRATARPQDEPTRRPGNKRVLVRRDFEWYEDQLNALKRLSVQEQLEGKQGSMSAMVREAIDDYLNKKSFKK
jgi:hypothetical protein